ncbi:phage tail assembly protein [Escherichia coli]
MNKENVITLDNPVKRGEQVIEQVTLMKPSAGTLRGVSLAAVANSEVDALIKVLPRMTAPMLSGTSAVTLRSFSPLMRRWGQTCLTSRKAHCVSLRRRPQSMC